jgi:hypothetical protein
MKTRYKGYEIEIFPYKVEGMDGFGFQVTDPDGATIDGDDIVCAEDDGVWSTEKQAYKWACDAIDSDIQYEEAKWMADEHGRL